MTRAQLDIDFYSQEAVLNPFPLYEQARAAGRVVWNDALPGWMVTSYEDCQTVLTDNGTKYGEFGFNPEMFPWFEAPNMISVDGEVHQRLRRCLSPLFTRSAIAKWEDRVNAVVDELLAPIAAGASSFDLIADFTMVPTIIVAAMLGVPESRHDDFRSWSNTIVSGLSFGHETEETRAVLRVASAELNAYLAEEIERHKVERPDDLLTALVEICEAGTISEDEVRSTAVLLLTAGYDTTAKVLSNTLVAFEMNPEQRRMVAADPSLVPDAIEEVLRWRGTVQCIPRLAYSDSVLAGTEIKTGEVIYAMIGAAGRDPERWDDPDTFDVTREVKTNFGFGYGPHLCLGAPLARLEAKVAIESMLRLAPEFKLSNLDFGPSFFVRGPESGTIEIAVAV
jgi:cytochrome P450